TVDDLQVLGRGREQLLQSTEVLDDAVQDRAGHAGYARQQSVTAWAGCRVQTFGRALQPHRASHGNQVEQVGCRQVGQIGEHLPYRATTPGGRDVVADDQFAVGVDPGHQLVQLQGEQAAVGAELDDLAGDLVGDPPDHLQALRHDGCVAHGDEVLDLQRRQGIGHLVEPHLVALERRDRLVGARQQLAAALQHVPAVPDVQADDPNRL